MEVEMKLHDLEHNLKIAHEENRNLRQELVRSQAANELCFRELQQALTRHVETLKSDQVQQESRLEDKIAAVQDSDGSDDSQDESDREEASAVKKADEDAANSLMASNDQIVKVL